MLVANTVSIASRSNHTKSKGQAGCKSLTLHRTLTSVVLKCAKSGKTRQLWPIAKLAYTHILRSFVGRSLRRLSSQSGHRKAPAAGELCGSTREMIKSRVKWCARNEKRRPRGIAYDHYVWPLYSFRSMASSVKHTCRSTFGPDELCTKDFRRLISSRPGYYPHGTAQLDCGD